MSGLVAAVVLAVLAALTGEAAEDRAGWRRITPSPTHWTGIVLGTSLVLLFAYVRLFVDSARTDAESQMTILTWLIAAFALGTVAVALSAAAIRRRAVRWRGGRIVWRHGRREVAADLADLSEIRRNWIGQEVLQFEDGTVLRVDPYARGAAQLFEAACERLAPERADQEDEA